MRAAVLSDNRALVEALEEQGLTVGPLDGAEVLVLDVERVTPEAMVALRRRALRPGSGGPYVVALMGWWDEREREYQQVSDFVLNAPVREWQISEMLEDVRGRVKVTRVA